MTAHDLPEGIGETDPLDERDLQILIELAEVHELLDPVPPLLAEVVLFGLGAHDSDAELARLVESEMVGAGSRGGTRGVEHARTVTFSSDHLTVMVTLQPRRDGSTRIDGWAAPGGALRAELRVAGGSLEAACDASGRFAFESVPAGPTQLVLHPTTESDPSVPAMVITPAVNL
ncbi:hypothetical protein D1871_12125 [Nakamurella silvestris]|nr:hypothetical protein D1871_12125 [Nakamurella silvestris]